MENKPILNANSFKLILKFCLISYFTFCFIFVLSSFTWTSLFFYVYLTVCIAICNLKIITVCVISYSIVDFRVAKKFKCTCQSIFKDLKCKNNIFNKKLMLIKNNIQTKKCWTRFHYKCHLIKHERELSNSGFEIRRRKSLTRWKNKHYYFTLEISHACNCKEKILESLYCSPSHRHQHWIWLCWIFSL